jgi:hypothetical protein
MPRSTRDADVSHDLRQAIHRTGYYPEVVTDGVFSAAGGEETTFDHEEVRRHLTALLLTPTRLVIAHTDEHPGDDMLPEPYTSTTTEAVTLTSIRTVVVTRMVANPTAGVAPPAEAVLTIGWGGVGRIDLEPAACSDPSCDADHGYTGTLAGDDYTLRVSAAAEGADAVGGLLAFADALSARTRG